MAHPDTDSNHPHTQAATQSQAANSTENQAHQPQGESSALQGANSGTNPGAYPGTYNDPRMSAAGLNARLDALEAKLAAMNDKLDATQHALDNFLTAHSPRMSGVTTPTSEAAGAPVAATDENTPGFVQDSAVQLFRKANILFESERYADANLAYANFLEKYPDHPLAGSAQFKIGEGYFSVARNTNRPVQEFQKVLDLLRSKSGYFLHTSTFSECRRRSRKTSRGGTLSPTTDVLASKLPCRATSAITCPTSTNNFATNGRAPNSDSCKS